MRTTIRIDDALLKQARQRAVETIGFVPAVRSSSAFVEILPDTHHFDRFLDLCERFELRGNDVSDAYLAALAIETRSDWVSFDRGFDRFDGLRRIEPGVRAPPARDPGGWIVRRQGR